jgi:hypothetical protein
MPIGKNLRNMVFPSLVPEEGGGPIQIDSSLPLLGWGKAREQGKRAAFGGCWPAERNGPDYSSTEKLTTVPSREPAAPWKLAY